MEEIDLCEEDNAPNMIDTLMKWDEAVPSFVDHGREDRQSRYERIRENMNRAVVSPQGAGLLQDLREIDIGVGNA